MKTKIIRLKRWKIEVFSDDSMHTYVVIAADEMDARIIAFCLDGGFSPDMNRMDGGHVALVQEYTKVLKVSSAPR